MVIDRNTSALPYIRKIELHWRRIYSTDSIRLRSLPQILRYSSNVVTLPEDSLLDFSSTPYRGEPEHRSCRKRIFYRHEYCCLSTACITAKSMPQAVQLQTAVDMLTWPRTGTIWKLHYRGAG